MILPLARTTFRPCKLRSFTSITTNAALGKQLAAVNAIDQSIQPEKHHIVGLGSGSTIEYAIQRIATRPDLHSLIYIPTSYQTRQLIIQNKLRLGTLEECTNGIDITIDGADEIDRDLHCIKGGGGCLFQERLVAQASQEWIVIADERKKSESLGTKYLRGIPVEVVPMAVTSVQSILIKMFPKATIQLRMATPTDKAGPVVTDNGNLLLDCHLGSLGSLAPSIYQDIKLLTGVVDVGLFCHMAKKVYFGNTDGTVDVWTKS
ncbi:putative ribose-5-phosphate ketol-isomerase [Halteromyces radiatus]|uniref:putative ribose-5-phosphate ketol-isomerase n=1 Tax=Halteromyces radiatus TaxID=101107 RepID=UPI00221E4193|nr:putative ribose-5-phosphate ketol-isomerase [Halteromyces radiatus]KAI8093555.1 putative ribose-5-phosphate ketol-isomerase [Halteromyces radiatus]